MTLSANAGNKAHFASYVVGWLRAHRTRVLLLFIGVLLPLCLFAVLADDVVENDTLAIDRGILLFIHGHATRVLDLLMLLFSRVGSVVCILPFDGAVLVLLVWRGRLRHALFWILAVGGAALLNWLAKIAYSRARPDLWISIAPETTFSFPSGHAMQSFAVVAALLVLSAQRWRWVTFLCGIPFVLLVGVSRMYLGVHYPSDILAGWIASLAWVAGLATLFADSRAFLSQPVQATHKAHHD